jgi:hypothetical protein
MGVLVRFFTPAAHRVEERLLWSRDTRFVARLHDAVPGSRIVELESGSCLIAPGNTLADRVADEIARASSDPEYGLVAVDSRLPEADRYITALSSAVQISGLADRIGMAQSTQIVQTKTLDYFFNPAQPPGLSSRSSSWRPGRSTSTRSCSGRTCRCCRSRSVRSSRRRSTPTGRSSSTSSSSG